MVSSIYFDNFKYSSYSNSNEGILPRKKIRLRYYNNDKKKILFEKKITSLDGRYKLSKVISDIEFNKYISLGIFDYDYGECKPKIFTNYSRDYFVFKNIRLTFDTNISYKIFGFNLKKKDIKTCIELKSNSSYDFFQSFNFFSKITSSRFSKYCRGIESFGLPK